MQKNINIYMCKKEREKTYEHRGYTKIVNTNIINIQSSIYININFAKI